MERYNKLLNWIDYLTSTIASIGAVYIKELLEKIIIDQQALIIIITVSCALIIFISLTYIFREIVKKTKYLKRIVLKENFIEGVWFDYILNENNEITGGGIVTIQIEEKNIAVSGDNFNFSNKMCRKIGDFKSKMAKIENGNLDFSYYSNNRFENKDAPGFARYKFPNTGFVPVIYESYFFSIDNKQKMVGVAEKIINKKKLKKLKNGSFIDRQELISEFIIEIDKRIKKSLPLV